MSDETYESCEWIEGGLSFNRRSLHACLIVHHDTGLPFITDYNGGEVPLETVLAVREKIRVANRRGNVHHECRGCAHLQRKAWQRTQYPIEIVGIAHYSYCNIKCSYCFLQTQDPASFASGYKPYSLLPVIRKLIDEKQLAPHSIIDWGGGEPSSYPEFDQLLELLLAHGTYHYIHSNGTRFPSSLRRAADPSRVHIICSVDAGLPATYKRIKQKDYLERVWGVLGEYIAVGSSVTLKYIMKEENCNDADIHAFVARAAQLKPRGVIVDFDYDYPDPGTRIINAMGRLKVLCQAVGVPARYGFTGSNFAPEYRIEERAEEAFQNEQRRLSPVCVQRPFTWRDRGFRRLLTSLLRRRPDRVTWLDANLPEQWFAGGLYQGAVRFRNDGAREWVHTHPAGHSVALAILLDGKVHQILPLPHTVAPGQETTIAFDMTFPAESERVRTLKLGLVEHHVAWLENTGAKPFVTDIRIPPAWTPPAACGIIDTTSQEPAPRRREVWSLPTVSQGVGCGG